MNDRSIFALPALLLLFVACGEDDARVPELSEPHEAHAATTETERPSTDHGDHARVEAADHEAHPHHEPLPVAAGIDESATLHDLPTVFRDPEDESVSFRDFHGHPTLVAMFYGSCTTVCPLILHDLAQIDEAVGNDRLRVAVVTFDPERDTPERLVALRQERGMDASRWKLLRGDEEGTRDLAMALGVQYRKLPDGEFAHSALIVLLDGEGHVIERHEGLGRPLDAVIAQARRLTEVTR